MSDKPTSPPSSEAVRVRRRDGEAEQAPAAEAAQETAPAPAAPAAAPKRRVFDPSTAVTPAKREMPKAAGLEIEGADDFEALLDEHTPDGPEPELEPGQSVTGEVIAIGQDTVFIDLGGKTEAFIDKADLLNDKGELVASMGDRVTGYVLGFARGGAVRVGLKMSAKGAASQEAIEQAFHGGVPVEGRVTALNKGGFEVEVLGARAFCPISQIELAYTEEPESHVGHTYTFQITEYGEKGRKFVVSRSALLKAQKEAQAEVLREQLEVGAVFQGTVSSIMDYGIFVDLGGLDGLVHISEMAWERLSHPSELVQVGQTVEAQVTKIDYGKKGERISLSMKATQGDPWNDLGDIKEGAKLNGRVVRLAHFGAFVELKPGLEGLIHISEMSWERRVRHPSDVLGEGDQAEVMVLSIDPVEKRIGLSLKAAQGNPWEGITERYPLGTELEVTVERIAEFGLFVKVENGVVGLIPMSESNTRPGTVLAREFKPGQTLTARVINVDEEGERFTLTLKEGDGVDAQPSSRGSNDRPRRRAPKKSQNYEDAGDSFATFGDLLKDKIGKD